MHAVKAFLAEGLSRRDFLAATFSPGLSRREGFSRHDLLAVRAVSRRVQAFSRHDFYEASLQISTLQKTKSVESSN